MLKKIIIIFICILCFPFLVISVGTRGGQILKVSHSARDKAMAEAVTADIPEISSYSYNPGGLAYVKSRQVSLTYLRWISDIYFSTLAYSQPLLKGIITGNLNYWGMGDFPQYNVDGVELDNPLKYSGLGISIGYGRLIKKDLSAGIKIKYFSETLMEHTSQALAFDIGGQYNLKVPSITGKSRLEKHKNLTLGLQLQNIGVYLENFEKKEILPYALKIGAHYKAYEMNHNVFYLNLDIHEYFSESPVFCFGLQWDMMDLLFIRGGYYLDLDENINKYMAGLGIQYLITSTMLGKLDYGIVPADDLGYTHFITLSLFFSSKGQRSK